MVSRWLFTALVALLGLQRLVELGISARHELVIRSLGGREYAAWQVQAMKALHAAWFIAMLVEVYALHRPFIPALSLLALVILIAGQSLRYAALLSLKWRWTIRVMTIPSLPLVCTGIYRYMRHPNYVGVALEFLAVPLLHSAFVTAFVFSMANGLLLAARLRTEESALRQAVNSPPPVVAQDT